MARGDRDCFLASGGPERLVSGPGQSRTKQLEYLRLVVDGQDYRRGHTSHPVLRQAGRQAGRQDQRAQPANAPSAVKGVTVE